MNRETPTGCCVALRLITTSATNYYPRFAVTGIPAFASPATAFVVFWKGLRGSLRTQRLDNLALGALPFPSPPGVNANHPPSMGWLRNGFGSIRPKTPSFPLRYEFTRARRRLANFKLPRRAFIWEISRMKSLRSLPLALLLIALISLAWIPVAGRGEAPESIPIPNANFEDGTNGWELVNLGKGGTMAMDEAELRNGKPTLRIDSPGQLTFAQRPVKVKPHTTYLLSGYIKVKDVHQTGGAGIAGAVVMTGGQFPYGAQGTYGTTDWRQVTTQLNTDDKTEIQVGPGVGWFGCKVSGTGWFSDLSLAELEEDRESGQDGAGSNLITNGNFERDTYGWERINFGMEGTMEMDPAELYEGKPTLRIESNETLTFARQIVTVKPHTTYRLSGFIKAKDVHDNGGIGSAGAELIVGSTRIKTLPILGTADWREVSVEFDTEGRTAIRVGPAVGFYDHKVIGTGWFSRMSLTEVERKQPKHFPNDFRGAAFTTAWPTSKSIFGALTF